MELLGDVGHVESRSVHLEMVLVLVQDRCIVGGMTPDTHGRPHGLRL